MIGSGSLGRRIFKAALAAVAPQHAPPTVPPGEAVAEGAAPAAMSSLARLRELSKTGTGHQGGGVSGAAVRPVPPVQVRHNGSDFASAVTLVGGGGGVRGGGGAGAGAGGAGGSASSTALLDGGARPSSVGPAGGAAAPAGDVVARARKAAEAKARAVIEEAAGSEALPITMSSAGSHEAGAAANRFMAAALALDVAEENALIAALRKDEVLRRLPPPPEGVWAPGQRVQAHFQRSKDWFMGVLVGKRAVPGSKGAPKGAQPTTTGGGGDDVVWSVLFDDGVTDDNVPPSSIRLLYPKGMRAGSRCRAKWFNGQRYSVKHYTGFIVEVNDDDTVSVLYDDGDFAKEVPKKLVKPAKPLPLPQSSPVPRQELVELLGATVSSLFGGDADPRPYCAVSSPVKRAGGDRKEPAAKKARVDTTDAASTGAGGGKGAPKASVDAPDGGGDAAADDARHGASASAGAGASAAEGSPQETNTNGGDTAANGDGVSKSEGAQDALAELQRLWQVSLRAKQLRTEAETACAAAERNLRSVLLGVSQREGTITEFVRSNDEPQLQRWFGGGGAPGGAPSNGLSEPSAMHGASEHPRSLARAAGGDATVEEVRLPQLLDKHGLVTKELPSEGDATSLAGSQFACKWSGCGWQLGRFVRKLGVAGGQTYEVSYDTLSGASDDSSSAQTLHLVVSRAYTLQLLVSSIRNAAEAEADLSASAVAEVKSGRVLENVAAAAAQVGTWTLVCPRDAGDDAA